MRRLIFGVALIACVLIAADGKENENNEANLISVSDSVNQEDADDKYLPVPMWKVIHKAMQSCAFACCRHST